MTDLTLCDEPEEIVLVAICPACGSEPKVPPETGEDLLECKNRMCPVHFWSYRGGEIDEDAQVVLDYKASI